MIFKHHVTYLISLINLGHLQTILLKYGLQDFRFDIESTYLTSGFLMNAMPRVGMNASHAYYIIHFAIISIEKRTSFRVEKSAKFSYCIAVQFKPNMVRLTEFSRISTFLGQKFAQPLISRL